MCSWRIALLERFWQARHPPRYAAFKPPSSPSSRHSSSLHAFDLLGFLSRLGPALFSFGPLCRFNFSLFVLNVGENGFSLFVAERLGDGGQQFLLLVAYVLLEQPPQLHDLREEILAGCGSFMAAGQAWP